MVRMVLKKLDGKQNIFIEKVGIYRVFSQECFARL